MSTLCTNPIQIAEWNNIFQHPCDVTPVDPSTNPRDTYLRPFFGVVLGDTRRSGQANQYCRIVEVNDFVSVVVNNENQPPPNHSVWFMDEIDEYRSTRKTCATYRRWSTWCLYGTVNQGRFSETHRTKVMNGRLRYVTDVETVKGKAKLLVVSAIHPQTRQHEFHQIIATQITPKDNAAAVRCF